MKRYKLQPWAPQIIEAHVLYNRTLPELAAYYRSSLNAVRYVFRAHGITPRDSKCTKADWARYRLQLCDRLGLDPDRGHPDMISYKRSPEISEPLIIQEYVRYRRSMDQIALFHGCCPMTVFNVLKRHNIPTRPRGRYKRVKEINQNGILE